MSSTTTELRQRVRRTVEKARQIAEHKDFNTDTELQRNFDRAMNEAKRLRDDADESELGDARAAMGSVIFGSGGNARACPTVGEDEIRAWIDPENPKRSLHLPLGVQARVDDEWYKDTAKTVKAGYTVPTSLLDRVIYHINGESSIWGESYHLNTTSGEDLTVPVLTTDATASLTAERSAATIATPVFGSETLKSYRVDGYFVLSMELMRDSGVDVTKIVGDAAGRAIGTQLGAYLATGTGSGEPEGITVGGVSAATCSAKTVFVMDELKTLYYSVPSGARRNGVFVCGTDSIALLAKLKDADGNYLWQPAIAQGQPDLLFGRPCLEDSAMPALATGNKPIAFGDLANYFYVRTVDRSNAGGILLEFDQSPLFTQFEVTARYAIWTDSRVMGTGGEVKYLTLA